METCADPPGKQADGEITRRSCLPRPNALPRAPKKTWAGEQGAAEAPAPQAARTLREPAPPRDAAHRARERPGAVVPRRPGRLRTPLQEQAVGASP